ncbi:hypothetical protein G5V57_23240 [Nordella sp. HKS 07]|uniref:hypothetical protein n=1 Tax=Nordella sp. HKS 07 TaxID=2712222 RepID=UPI0013E1A080|nr:hypothetical protein [Nordella sp. HKS 07]QIG50387.1 hypothetical protein G5V57_23240 [Nordella sp. HKS 07]
MPPIPAEQVSPFDSENHPNHVTPFPHLTTNELAARWRCTVFTISAKYRSLGLRPIRVGKRLLFPIVQIEAAERRSMGAQ